MDVSKSRCVNEKGQKHGSWYQKEGKYESTLDILEGMWHGLF